MANLPNKSFVFNFNAKNYNTSTRTIPNETGATMNKDMVWSGRTSTVINNITFDTDHITVPISGYSFFNFGTSGSNPMNNTAAEPSMTIVAKFKYNTSSAGSNFFNNRDNSTYNYFARCGVSKGVGSLSLGTLGGGNGGPTYDTSKPVIASWRVNASRSIDIKNITEGTSTNVGTTTWNGGTKWFTFFIWKSGTGTANSNWREFMGGDFYWCYATREVLTDAEIQQVVKFNESTFGPDENSADVPYSGGTVSVNLAAEGVSWTASTANNWITISPTTGTGDSVVTLTVKNNNFGERAGTVTFTSGTGDVAEFTVNQGGTDGILPYKKIYRNDRRIN